LPSILRFDNFARMRNDPAHTMAEASGLQAVASLNSR